MVWAPPAMLIVLVVVAALFGLLFFAVKVINWGREGKSEEYEHKGLLDSIQERLTRTQELATGIKELDESWKQLTGTQKGIAAEEYIIKCEMLKAELIRRMSASATSLKKFGPGRTLKQYGDTATNVLFGYVNKYWRTVYNELSQINQVLNLEDYQKKMDEFKQKQTQYSERLTQKEIKLGNKEKTETGKMVSSVKKQKNASQLSNEASGMQKLETAVSKFEKLKGKRLKNMENFQNEGAKQAKEVKKFAKKFGDKLKDEIKLAAEFSNLLKSGKITNKNVMKYYNPLLDSTRATESILKKLEKAQELEATARENELTEMTAVDNLMIAIEDRSAKKLGIEKQFDINSKNHDAAKAGSEQSKDLALKHQAGAEAATSAREKTIATAQKNRIDADRKSAEKIKLPRW